MSHALLAAQSAREPFCVYQKQKAPKKRFIGGLNGNSRCLGGFRRLALAWPRGAPRHIARRACGVYPESINSGYFESEGEQTALLAFLAVKLYPLREPFSRRTDPPAPASTRRFSEVGEPGEARKKKI